MAVRPLCGGRWLLRLLDDVFATINWFPAISSMVGESIQFTLFWSHQPLLHWCFCCHFGGNCLLRKGAIWMAWSWPLSSMGPKSLPWRALCTSPELIEFSWGQGYVLDVAYTTWIIAHCCGIAMNIHHLMFWLGSANIVAPFRRVSAVCQCGHSWAIPKADWFVADYAAWYLELDTLHSTEETPGLRACHCIRWSTVCTGRFC